jgi:hypothetical protein
MEKIIGKYKIEVMQDENAQSPDDWGNDDAFIVFDHRQFYIARKGFEPQDIFDNRFNKDYKTYNGYWIFPLYAYIHSGVVLSVGSHNFPDARWDVSFKGFVLIQRTKGMYTSEKAMKIAKSIVEEWNLYLSGEVYGYKITDTETNEEADSCWGFYGEEENCMTEAEDIVNTVIESDQCGQIK